MPKVTLIIPTHCRAHLLPRAVESARQAGKDIEIIVVDDASNDATAELCRTLTGINYIRLDRNRGVAGARNAGILASSADYIAFLDDDDLRLPNTLDLQHDVLSARRDAGFVCGPVLLADQEGILTGEISTPKHSGGDMFWELLELDFPIYPSSVLVRKSCFSSVGLLDSRIPGRDDWDLWVRLAERFHGIVVQEPMSVYRESTPFSNQGLSDSAAFFLGVAAHQQHLLRLPRVLDAPAARRKAARRGGLNNISDILLWQAFRCLSEGEYRLAGSNIVTALRISPSQVARTVTPANFRKVFRQFRARKLDPHSRFNNKNPHRQAA